MRLLPAADRAWTAWKNGGGVTSEVATGPEGATLDDFAWRVSIARIDRDGAFSPFPGVTRTQLVLSGGVVTLTGPDWEVLLRVGSEPFTFSGEDMVHARIDAPALVLNLMRRGAGTSLPPPQTLMAPATFAGPMLVLTLDGGVSCAEHTLAALDAVLLDDRETVEFRGAPGPRLLTVSLR